MLLIFSVFEWDFSHGIMMGHYFHHLTIVNRQLFIVIAMIFVKCRQADTNYNSKHDRSTQGQRNYSSMLMLIYPIANWLCIRYEYHLPFYLLIQNIIMILEPTAYFYNFFRPGATQAKLSLNNNNLINSFQVLILSIGNGK